MITRFQTPNMYVIRFVILKEEKSFNARFSPGPRSGQSGHCVGELQEEVRNKSGQGNRFSLAQIGVISAGCIVRSGSKVLPYNSNSFLFLEFTMKSVDFKILVRLSQFESPPGMSRRPL